MGALPARDADVIDLVELISKPVCIDILSVMDFSYGCESGFPVTG
jgi:hypothetical protein